MSTTCEGLADALRAPGADGTLIPVHSDATIVIAHSDKQRPPRRGRRPMATIPWPRPLTTALLPEP
jgi:hypothetical protein